jgi:hypothetical protein
MKSFHIDCELEDDDAPGTSLVSLQTPGSGILLAA